MQGVLGSIQLTRPKTDQYKNALSVVFVVPFGQHRNGLYDSIKKLVPENRLFYFFYTSNVIVLAKFHCVRIIFIFAANRCYSKLQVQHSSKSSQYISSACQRTLERMIKRAYKNCSRV